MLSIYKNSLEKPDVTGTDVLLNGVVKLWNPVKSKEDLRIIWQIPGPELEAPNWPGTSKNIDSKSTDKSEEPIFCHCQI